MTVVTWLLSRLGIAGCLLFGLYVYEEGIPGAYRIPFLTSVPILGDLTTGRVHTFAAQQVKLATATSDAKWAGRMQQMVSAADLEASKAQLAETKRQRDAAANSVAALAIKQAADEAFNEQLQAQDEREISDYAIQLKAAGKDCTVDAARADWLSKH